MNITISNTGSTLRTLAIDALLIAVVCTVPALSHVFSLPFYQLNPMALCLLAGMVLVADRRNAFLLAVLLPVVSMLAVGMPSPLKAVCMVAEMLTVAGAYSLLQRRLRPFGSVLAALLGGKVVYYLLKALLISPAVLVGTSIWLQLATVVVYSIAFAFVSNKRNGR